MKNIITGASLGALAVAIASPAAAQDADAPAAQERQGGVNTIIVTAQRRSEDLQDVPISVSAIGEEQLEELNIDTFEDYLDQIPSVTAGGNGPGQSTIYIRGLASTTPNITVAGVAGLAPNVALYLNDQPLSQPGRNLVFTPPTWRVSRCFRVRKALYLAQVRRQALYVSSRISLTFPVSQPSLLLAFPSPKAARQAIRASS